MIGAVHCDEYWDACKKDWIEVEDAKKVVFWPRGDTFFEAAWKKALYLSTLLLWWIQLTACWFQVINKAVT